jgi:hypothetical protein
MNTKHFWSRFTHTAELPLRLMVIVSMLISALMLPLGTASAVSSNRAMCENDASLVGCWRMEEGSGTSLQDGGATPFNDGTLTNSPTWVAGKYGQGLGFNGTNQYVLVPDENSLDITSAITLAAWVKPGKVGTQNIIKKAIGTGAPGGYELSLSSGGIVFIRLNGGTTTTTRLDSTITYPTDGTWMHIAATTDGTAIKVYINGALNTSKTVSAFTINTNATNVGIGAEMATTPLNFFQGVIDDARIYNRALSASEILALASTTPPGDVTPPAAPTGLSAVPGDTTVALTWDALALPHDVKGWNVYRSETSPVDTGTPLHYVTTESYTDNDPLLVNGTLYYYTVKAVDTSNNLSNPATEASATPYATCYALTLNSGANGSAPTADPTQSTGCPAGEYKASEAIDLTAHPDSGYEVDTWTGTNNDTLKTLDNTLTMPANIHTVTVTYTAAVNDAPVVTDIPDQTIAEGGSFSTISLDNYVSDPDNTDAEMDWSWSGNIDLSVAIDGNRVATITITDADWNGFETITFTATDPGLLSDEDAATFTVTAVDDPPEVTNPGAQSNAEGDVISLQITATDEDSLDLDYSALNLPQGLSIDPASGLISGTISYYAAANSPHSTSVTVTDDTTPVTVNFTWTVTQTAFGACAGETGLVGCWQMEEGSGSAIYDGSSLGNDGTTTGGPAWEAGKIDTWALSLNGTSQYASVPDDDSLDLTEAFTVAGWIKPGKQATQDLFKKAQMTTTDGFEIGLSSPTAPVPKIVFFRLNQASSGDGYRVNSTTEYPFNNTTWMHVAATYDGTTMRLYINGTQEGGDLAGPGTYLPNNLPFMLGAQPTSPRYYQGAMDDVRLYDRALTLEEIQVLAGLNIAPVVTDIPDQTIEEGATFATINLDDYVSDVDNTDTEMTWTHTGETDLNVSIVDRVATITTPDADWFGSELITFTATDPGLLFDEDSATFTVTGLNDAPVVSDIPDQTIVEGASFTTINLDDYVSDVDHAKTELIWSASGNTLLGVSIVDRVATITIPGADWYGSETITFKATDLDALWDDDPATFTVDGMNDAPILDAIGPRSTAELVPLLFTATAADIDLPPDPLTYSLANGTAGSVPEGAEIGLTSGDFSWTPTEAQGPDIYTFDVCVSDGFLSDCETIIVTVSEVATAPVATADAYEVLESGIFTVAAPGVLANDGDADIPADILTAFVDTTTAHGSLDLNEDGSFSYIPDDFWSGVDTFTYRVFDGDNYSEPVTVTITVKLLKYFMPMILN